MDTNYLDFGLNSDSDGEDGKMNSMDSDEEDAAEASTLMKMMTCQIPMPHSKTKRECDIEDFEAEMEMELNRRADAMEAQGGVEFQQAIYRSPSNSSLKSVTKASSKPSRSTDSTASTKSSLKKSSSSKSLDSKTVRFIDLATTSSAPPKPSKDKVKDMYDEIYFDSEDDDDIDPATSKAKRTGARKFLSNDELFYDPKADDKDQHWIDDQRKQCFIDSKGVDRDAQENPKPLPNSDAVLNCPACFTLLCLDCQRHEFYESQFRAMFVRNCITNTSINRFIPAKSDRFKRKRKVDGETLNAINHSASFQTDSSDTFNPVNCKVCNTEVGVYDSEEVYHFYNVLTSHS